MSKRVRDKQSRHSRDPGRPTLVQRWRRPVLLGWLTANFVAAPLIPTDVIPSLGTGTGLILFWLGLLVVWLLLGWAAGGEEVRWGPTTIALAVFLALHSLSALVMYRFGHPRATLNTMWLWIGLGVAFVLSRQLLRSAAECRAMISVMIALAVVLSMFGYYQYFVSMPRARQAYERDPEKALERAGVYAPAGSAERKLFEDRLYSTEPISTFTLTNSLAGFLSPWLLVAIGLAVTSRDQPPLRSRLLLASLLSTALIGGCWILTKSRTAWLATSFGLVLLGLYGRPASWRPDWRIVSLALGALVLLITFGILVGGLDWFVVVESSKALLYRFQYWQSTALLIQDYPWLGCGPGNFQQYYQAYKLPEASETVAEPHNFVFEIWATAGTFALLAFLAVMVCFVWQLRSLSGGAPEAAPRDHVRSVYWGALAGVLLAFACGSIVGYMPAVEILGVGLPVGAALLLVWHPWVIEGQLPDGVTCCAISVLLVNLLAAGGIGYAGVALTLWLVMAVTLNLAEGAFRPSPVSRGRLLGAAVAAAALAWLFCQTMYWPLLRAGELTSRGRLHEQTHRLDLAEASYQEAARADPYSPDPWMQLAALRHRQWLATGSRQRWTAFSEAAGQMLARNQRSSQAYTQHGHWLLAAYRRTGDPQHLQAAIAAYQPAVDLYPNDSAAHAQLGWTLHLAGRSQAAADQAEKALRLDGQNPHSEQKLKVQQLFDPGPAGSDQPPGPDADAEQLMRQLRSGSEIVRE